MNGRPGRGTARLSLSVLAIILVWTIVLPRVAGWESIRRRIDALNRQGIDPAALYYTDVEAMTRIEADMNATRAAHPEAFWSLRGAMRKTRDKPKGVDIARRLPP